VLGPNGAGKTTAVRILATLPRPDHLDRLAGADSHLHRAEHADGHLAGHARHSARG
jgi:ABC-type multidrug transport system ATPase subunit